MAIVKEKRYRENGINWVIQFADDGYKNQTPKQKQDVLDNINRIESRVALNKAIRAREAQKAEEENPTT